MSKREKPLLPFPKVAPLVTRAALAGAMVVAGCDAEVVTPMVPDSGTRDSGFIGPMPPPADAGTDAGFIGPMPPPMDAGSTGEDAGFIGPMPPPIDADVLPDAGGGPPDDGGFIGPMPPPIDADVIPPMPPPMPPPPEE